MGATAKYAEHATPRENTQRKHARLRTGPAQRPLTQRYNWHSYFAMLRRSLNSEYTPEHTLGYTVWDKKL